MKQCLLFLIIPLGYNKSRVDVWAVIKQLEFKTLEIDSILQLSLNAPKAPVEFQLVQAVNKSYFCLRIPGGLHAYEDLFSFTLGIFQFAQAVLNHAVRPVSKIPVIHYADVVADIGQMKTDRLLFSVKRNDIGRLFIHIFKRFGKPKRYVNAINQTLALGMGQACAFLVKIEKLLKDFLSLGNLETRQKIGLYIKMNSVKFFTGCGCFIEIQNGLNG